MDLFDFLVKAVTLVAALAFVTLVGAVFMLPLVALQAYVISDLWSMFITPWVHVAMPASVWMTAGILLTIRVAATGMHSKSSKDDKKSSDKSWKEVAEPWILSYLGVLLIWGLGYLFHWLGA